MSEDNVTTLIVLLILALLLAMGLLLRLLYNRSQYDEWEQEWLHRIDDAEVAHLDLHRSVIDTLPTEGVRYEIVLTDWGPDFTGEDGTLPRWRWAVLDADRALRKALGIGGSPDDMGSEEMPYMLGNAPLAYGAVLDAVRWTEEHQHPVLAVTIGEVTPWRARA